MSETARVEPLADGTGLRVRVRDGRYIGVRQAGAPGGWPLLLFPGTPGSRLHPLADLDEARDASARVVVLERPGFGVSSSQPGRRILDWPDDVARVADALDIGVFAIAGISGAGPYLAACAHALPDRVHAVGMCGVLSPLDAPGVRRGMTLRRRLMYRALPLMPHAVPLLRALGPSGIDRAMTADVPPCDRAILERLAEPYAAFKREALRQGPMGVASELALAARPWGFRLQDIGVPVHLWHGELDASTPIAMGRHLADVIPGCRARFIADAGHFVAFSRWSEILAALKPPA